MALIQIVAHGHLPVIPAQPDSREVTPAKFTNDDVMSVVYISNLYWMVATCEEGRGRGGEGEERGREGCRVEKVYMYILRDYFLSNLCSSRVGPPALPPHQR